MGGPVVLGVFRECLNPFYALVDERMRDSFPVDNVLADDTLTVLPLIILIARHPLDKLAAEPKTLALHIVKFVTHVADAVFHSVPPEAAVRLGAEFPNVGSLPVSLVVLELPLVIAGAVQPLQVTLSVLLVVQPLAFVLNPVGPRVNTLAADLVVEELSVVDTAVWTVQLANATLLAIDEVANVA